MSSHYTELINLKSALNTPKGLCSLYNQTEKNLRSLKALEQDTNQDIFYLNDHIQTTKRCFNAI